MASPIWAYAGSGLGFIDPNAKQRIALTVTRMFH
jgi:hypothetical protein